MHHSEEIRMCCWGSEWKEWRPYISLLGCYIHQSYENLQKICQLKANGLDLVSEKINGWFNCLTYWFLLKRMSPASWPLFGRCLYTSQLLVPLKKETVEYQGMTKVPAYWTSRTTPDPVRNQFTYHEYKQCWIIC